MLRKVAARSGEAGGTVQVLSGFALAFHRHTLVENTYVSKGMVDLSPPPNGHHGSGGETAAAFNAFLPFAGNEHDWFWRWAMTHDAEVRCEVHTMLLHICNVDALVSCLSQVTTS